MAEQAILSMLGVVQPRREPPGVTEEGFALVDLQREPSKHGGREEAEFLPRQYVVRHPRVGDARSEYGVAQEVVVFWKVPPRPFPDLADSGTLRRCPHRRRVVD